MTQSRNLIMLTCEGSLDPSAGFGGVHPVTRWQGEPSFFWVRNAIGDQNASPLPTTLDQDIHFDWGRRGDDIFYV